MFEFLKRKKKRLTLKGATDLQVFDMFHHAVIGLYGNKYSCAMYAGKIIVFTSAEIYQKDVVFTFDELRDASHGIHNFIACIQEKLK